MAMSYASASSASIGLPESDPAASSSSSASGPSTSTFAGTATPQNRPHIKNLVLDAGPLLTQSPLRGIASKFFIPPQVIDELKDKRAKEHLEWLRTTGQVDIEVRDASVEALSRVISFSRKTGDYAVLSQPDLSVLALTCTLEMEENGLMRLREAPGQPPIGKRQGVPQQPVQLNTSSIPSIEVSKLPARAAQSDDGQADVGEGLLSVPAEAEDGSASGESEGDYATAEDEDEGGEHSAEDGDGREELSSAMERTILDDSDAHKVGAVPALAVDGIESVQDAEQQGGETDLAAAADDEAAEGSGEEEEEEDDDGEGDWITPANVAQHKYRDLGLLPDEGALGMEGNGAGGSGGSKKVATVKPQTVLKAACMTADYAVQNVLLQMGMNLVSVDGKRVKQVKSWTLRCHACFKVCKDASKKFCPSCGGPTLLRTSVTTTADGQLKLHLKKNFQYRNRGTVYSIPAPKPGHAGSSSGRKGPLTGGSGLILREDQVEWQRAVKREEGKRAKDERRIQRALENGKGDAAAAATLTGRYDDPDWLPSLMTASASGKDRDMGAHGMPAVGHGRKNPNERRRRK